MSPRPVVFGVIETYDGKVNFPTGEAVCLLVDLEVDGCPTMSGYMLCSAEKDAKALEDLTPLAFSWLKSQVYTWAIDHGAKAIAYYTQG